MKQEDLILNEDVHIVGTCLFHSVKALRKEVVSEQVEDLEQRKILSSLKYKENDDVYSFNKQALKNKK
jgi:hypothetical protein